jgi:hypothetical protein
MKFVTAKPFALAEGMVEKKEGDLPTVSAILLYPGTSQKGRLPIWIWAIYR